MADTILSSTHLPPVAPPKCESCAAVKRLKTCGADESSASNPSWTKQPCTCHLLANASSALACSSKDASPSDTLRPRRLFDGDDSSTTAADGSGGSGAGASSSSPFELEGGGTALCFDDEDVDEDEAVRTALDGFADDCEDCDEPEVEFALFRANGGAGGDGGGGEAAAAASSASSRSSA